MNCQIITQKSVALTCVSTTKGGYKRKETLIALRINTVWIQSCSNIDHKVMLSAGVPKVLYVRKKYLTFTSDIYLLHLRFVIHTVIPKGYCTFSVPKL